MFTLALIMVFLSGALLVFGVRFEDIDKRPTLKLYELAGILPAANQKPKERFSPVMLIRWIAVINKPLVTPMTRQKLFNNISVGMTPEEFYLSKEILMIGLVLLVPRIFPQDMFILGIFMALGLGWVEVDEGGR